MPAAPPPPAWLPQPPAAGGGATPARGEVNRIVVEAIAQLDERLPADALPAAPLSPGRISVPRALSNTLMARLASVVAGEPPPPPPSPVRDLVTRALYVARHAGVLARSARAPRGGRRILAVLRQENHFAEALPVLEHLERVGIASTVIVFRERQLALLAKIHCRIVLAHPLRLSAACVREETVAAWSAAAAERVGEATGVDVGSLRRAIDSVFAQWLPEVGSACGSVAAAIGRETPRVVLVGNPCTMEGRIAVAQARARQIPTVALQHGDLHPRDPQWSDAEVDHVCVWGARSRDALLRCGFRDDQLHVTGSARLRWSPVRDTSGDAVLVALSGAGNTVSLEEHRRVIRQLVAAATRTAGHAWVFRLHPKDDPALYRDAFREAGATNCRLSPAAQRRPPIDVELREAAVLVTVGSTAALDAMRVGVPVVTLERPPGERVAAFVEAGATRHVTRGEDLGAAIAEVLSTGLPAPVRERAEAFATSFYGPPDRMAVQRIAALVERF